MAREREGARASSVLAEPMGQPCSLERQAAAKMTALEYDISNYSSRATGDFRRQLRRIVRRKRGRQAVTLWAEQAEGDEGR